MDIVLMETRVSANRAHKILERINMPNFIEVPPKGLSGGMWLLWKNNVDSRIDIIITQKFIHTQIRDNKKDIFWLATFLYGYLHHL